MRLVILEICIHIWKIIPTFSFTYAVVYGDLHLFLPVFSRQCAVVLRGFIDVLLTMAWENKAARLVSCVRQRVLVRSRKFTVEGWRS